MKNFTIYFLLFCLSISVSFGQEKKNIKVSYKNNLKFKTANLSLNIGGRIMYDNNFFHESNKLSNSFSTEQVSSASQFRRLFLFSSGTINNAIEYKLQMNIVNAKIGLRDAYIGIKNIPFIGNVRVGQVKEPLRLEVLNSSNYLTFIERSFNVDFMLIRNSGILLKNSFNDQKLSYQLGFFRQADGSTGNDTVGNNNLTITGRLASLIVNKENQFLHIAAGSSYRTYDSDEYRVASKPEANLSLLKYSDTNVLTDVDKVNIYQAEVAYGVGAFNFQTEYLTSLVDKVNETLQLNTYYGQVSYFLTKEHKELKSSYAGFKRIKPLKSYGIDGYGALELALRYSYNDLNDGSIAGGEMSNVTFGVNWYLTSSTKVLFNQSFGTVKDKGSLTSSLIRFQIDF
ncbi:OprO/OprP family phosphate-selective porin [Flavobacteriaceae bacterium]|nr:OprO/OprP family phosphate-selective porin [Flavobacteriaceae bacterium]